MYGYTRDQYHRLVRNPTPNLELIENNSQNDENLHVGHGRTMRDYLNPTLETPLSCIVNPMDNPNANFTVKAHHLQMLPHFHGMQKENPYLHVRDFEEVVSTICSNPLQLTSARMKLFPFSLKDQAKSWLNSLKSQSIVTWEEMQGEFYKKFFPLHRTRALKKLIISFAEREGESFGECWERFKVLLTDVPHHGFVDAQVVAYFYEGISQRNRQFIDMMCNGTFMDKEPTEALEYFDFLAENNQSWDYSDPNDRTPSNAIQTQGTGGNIKLESRMTYLSNLPNLLAK